MSTRERTAGLDGASTATHERRALLVAAVVAGLLIAVAAVALEVPGPEVRSTASSLGLLVSGLSAFVSCLLRARRAEGRRRRTWLLLSSAATVAVAGNLWSAVTTDPSSRVSDFTIAIALVLSIAGVLHFPLLRRRGSELLALVLDGLIAGAAVLIIASSLIYAELLDATSGGFLDQATVLLIPVLDVVLATVASILFLRANHADRPVMAFISVGFVMYALSDLHYAVQDAQGDYAFGSWSDLGWIAGYLFIALAAWAPDGQAGPEQERPVASGVRGTVAIFVVLLGAGIVQIMAESATDVQATQAFLWLVLIFAAALRQVLLSRENLTLRLGLEQQVASQTADLRLLVRQTNVLIDSVGDGIYGVDADGRLTFVSRSARDMLGLDDHHIGGLHAHDLFHAPAPDGTPYPVAGCYITEAIESGTPTNPEDDVYVRTDGSRFDVEITASPIVEPDTDRVTGAVVVFRDATQRREVERMKDHFLSVVSHELRTPLTSIRGSLGLIAGGAVGELDPAVQHLASMALDSSERLGRLINDILDVERLASGTFDLQRAPHEARVLLDAAVSELVGLGTGGVRILATEADGLVLTDADRFAQVMNNLVGNAVKFSEEGSVVELSARVEGREVVFSVRDEGRGIPGDKLEVVFERFRQVDSSDSRVQGGTGLGLAITREIVEQMGGRIWAESEVGVGSVFRFTLPVAKLPVGGAAETSHEGPAGELAGDAGLDRTLG